MDFGLIVAAEDAFGNFDPSFEGSVSLALAGNPASNTLAGIPTVTADDGTATFSDLTLTKATIAVALEATSGSLTSATTSSIMVTAGPATQLVVTTQPPSSVTAGSDFGLVAVAEDEFGNVDPDFARSVSLALASAGIHAGDSPGGALNSMASAGVASFTDVTLSGAATGTVLELSSSGLTTATTNPITVTAAAADHLVVASEPPGSLTAGSGFGITVAAEDPFGNVDPAFDGTVTLALASNPAGDTLGGTMAVAAQVGLSTFAALVLDRVAPADVLEASSAGLMSATARPIAVGAGAASQLVVTSEPPGSVNANAGFSLVVSAEDDFGNVDPTFSGQLSLALATNPGGATLAGPLSTRSSGGVASFSALMVDQGGDGYSLRVTANGLGSAVTSNVTVIPLPARVVAVSLQKQSVQRHKTSLVIVVQFDEPLDPAAAANLGAYALKTVAERKSQRSKPVVLGRSSYNPVTNTVTLVPLKKLVLSSRLQLVINASLLTDARGRPLDGNDDGQAGGNFLATLSKGGVSVASAARTVGAQHVSALAVDVLLNAGFRP